MSEDDKEGWVCVLDVMASDFTRDEWAKKIGISLTTLKRWQNEYGWKFGRIPDREQSRRVSLGKRRKKEKQP